MTAHSSQAVRIRPFVTGGVALPDLDLHRLLAYQAGPDTLAGRVILVTGAAHGIGQAVSLGAAAAGATIILLDRDIKGLERTYDTIDAAGQPQPAIYPLNFEGATVKDYADLADNILQTLGRLDGLVLNAGWAGSLTPMKYYDPELWARVIQCNLNGPVLLTQAVLPMLGISGQGAIVVSTQNARKAFWGAFGMAKAAQDALIDILAAEHSNDQGFIRVNGIDTGPVRTRLRAQHYPGENPAGLPIPEQVVGPYLYLLGPEAGRLTGQNLSFQGMLQPPVSGQDL
jgi:NAD(P)-dependent dehydrogenase (short-subunit alcohol dehydrogenase family)